MEVLLGPEPTFRQEVQEWLHRVMNGDYSKAFPAQLFYGELRIKGAGWPMGFALPTQSLGNLLVEPQYIDRSYKYIGYQNLSLKIRLNVYLRAHSQTQERFATVILDLPANRLAALLYLANRPWERFKLITRVRWATIYYFLEVSDRIPHIDLLEL